MIDLHTHILPGLDDGAQTLEEALGMAELAVEGGVDMLVATPHSNQMGRFENFSSGALLRAYQQLERAIEREGIALNLYLGMEIFASGDMAEKIGRGMLFGLNRSRYYLVEFAFDETPEEVEGYLRQILSTGGVPLLAHPERYFCVQDYPGLVYEWLQMGCTAQVNKGSVFGRFGRRAARTAETLLHSRLATCVASDAHSTQLRTTYMDDIRVYLHEQFGEQEARRLLLENPDHILRDEPVPPHGRMPEQRRFFF